ncbi:MAG: hypothetical protein HJJLKODD_00872 [Phycisphaerae bacterium]|nr:hypothetical protein [Phycisphaerae bacterium]
MKYVLTIIVGCLCYTAAGLAQNVDLATLPGRDTVQLTIYNSEDLTLAREVRHITFKQGLNSLQFSWAGTLIDPTSVEVRFKSHADELELLDSTFPHDKREMVYWNIESKFDGVAEVEISYFTSGLSWSADYVVISDPDEKQLRIDSFIRVYNNSGEEYEDAQVRLVVGTINLVEPIAQLAQSAMDQFYGLELHFSRAEDTRNFETLARARRALDKAEAAGSVFGGGEGGRQEREKQIIKEGLSEYFIYTIEGTETIRNGWSKRMRSFGAGEVAFKVQYRYRPAEYGDQMVKMFLLRNDTESKLGTTPLPDGTVQVFRDNGRDGLSFLGQQYVKYVPIGEMIELNLGPDAQVIHQLVRQKSWRDDFWFHRAGADIYFSPTEGHRIEIDDNVVGWWDHEQWVERIRNYSGKEVNVEIRRAFDGHVEYASSLDPTLYDFRTPQITATIPAGEIKDLAYQINRAQGTLAQQYNVTIKKSE